MYYEIELNKSKILVATKLYINNSEQIREKIKKVLIKHGAEFAAQYSVMSSFTDVYVIEKQSLSTLLHFKRPGRRL